MLYEEALLQIQKLQLQVHDLQKMLFGSRHEKFITPQNDTVVQQDLFPLDKIAENQVIKTTLVKAHEKVKTALRPNHPGRSPLPDTLRREVIELAPVEDVSHLTVIGKEVTEVLEYQPGELFIKQYVRPEYIQSTSDGLNAKRIIAALPQQPLEKSIAGASLLSHLVVSKFVDHLPIYRQIEIFKRQQVKIDHTTASGWIRATTNLIKPLYDTHCKLILQSNYLNVDETTIKVLDKNKKGATHRGYYWVYYDTQNKAALFDYQPGRGGQFPQCMLDRFEGYLQTDGYVAYEQFDNNKKVTTLCCWAHARRKFFEALGYDKVRAENILSQIQLLYKVESHCSDHHFTPEQVKHYRTEHAVPVLENLHQSLKDLLLTGLPQSPLGKAVQYTLARWEKLCRYTTNGILRIDNNLVENSIRPVALGRKNYLFAGSHDAAQDAAMIYSLFVTCRLHGINPQTWLEDILCKVKTTPKEDLHLLLPQNYATKMG